MQGNQDEPDRQGNDEQKKPEQEAVNTSSSSVQNVKGDSVDINQGHIVHNYYNFSEKTGLEFLIKSQKISSGSFDSMISNLENDSDPTLRSYANVSQSTASDTLLTNEDGNTQQVKVKPLTTPGEIHTWYCEKLTEWEACFVQAAAVLHGSPIYQVREAAETLAPESLPASRIPEEVFFEHTYTKKVWANGAERLFWYDANTNGLSIFATQVLSVVVSQSNVSRSSQQEQHFLKQLEIWSTTLSGESAWRAIRALGTVWKKSDEARLRRLANQWARSDDPDDWRRAATLLDGAYEVEYAEKGEQVYKENNSLVLNLLTQWTREAHASFQTNIGSTVAQAYARIGQRTPEPALRRLDALLLYPLRSKKDAEVKIPLLVFVSATWSYVTLARFGYAREVLAHIASLVTKYCYQRRSPVGPERHEYLAQCRLMLDALFHVFFLIAAASLSGASSNKSGNYKRASTLPEHPAIPGKQQEDVLLAGILSSEEAKWRQHITTILCAAIIEANAEPAFYLMRLWAELTLNELGMERNNLREAYLNFLVEAEAKSNQWCSELAKAEEISYADLSCQLWQETLEQWQREGRQTGTFLGAFARDVIRRLKV